MTDMPSDLIPLSSQPWDERPMELPITVEEARTALWLGKGIVSKAAGILKVPPARLRRLVKNSPRLQEEIEEAKEQMKDKVEENIWDALEDTVDPGRRDSMTRFVGASLGRDRGFGNGAGGVGIVAKGSGSITITWDDGTEIKNGDDAKVINADG